MHVCTRKILASYLIYEGHIAADGTYYVYKLGHVQLLCRQLIVSVPSESKPVSKRDRIESSMLIKDQIA